MHFLDYFNTKTLKFDLINKFYYTNLKNLPKLKKVVLNFCCKTTELKTLAADLLALELVLKQKGMLTSSKRPNLLLKIRKGSPAGCSLTLKKPFILSFITKSLHETFSKIKNFDKLLISQKVEKTTFSFTIKNTLNFSELSEHYYLFNNLSDLNVSIITVVETREEMLFLLKSLQLPLKTIKASITQLVECNLAKIKVEGSNPFTC